MYVLIRMCFTHPSQMQNWESCLWGWEHWRSRWWRPCWTDCWWSPLQTASCSRLQSLASWSSSSDPRYCDDVCAHPGPPRGRLPDPGLQREVVGSGMGRGKGRADWDSSESDTTDKARARTSEHDPLLSNTKQRGGTKQSQPLLLHLPALTITHSYTELC